MRLISPLQQEVQHDDTIDDEGVRLNWKCVIIITNCLRGATNCRKSLTPLNCSAELLRWISIDRSIGWCIVVKSWTISIDLYFPVICYKFVDGVITTNDFRWSAPLKCSAEVLRWNDRSFDSVCIVVKSWTILKLLYLPVIYYKFVDGVITTHDFKLLSWSAPLKCSAEVLCWIDRSFDWMMYCCEVMNDFDWLVFACNIL